MDDQQNAPQQPPQPVPQPAPAGAMPGTGPTGMPVRPFYYTPETFNKLYMWWWILIAAGIVTAVIVIGFFALIAAYVLGCMLLYKSWNQIQDGYQKTTPGKAVGFLFIPFFNFYWMFVCMTGLAQNLNSFGKRNGVQMTPVSESLAMTFCILNVCSIVPYLGFLAAIGAIVIAFIMFNQFKTASAQIAEHMGGGANSL